MKLFLVMFLAVSSTVMAIDEGFKAKEGQFPSVVRLNIFQKQPAGFFQFVGTCTGTVIGSKTVLTAAHCAPKNNQLILVSRPGDPKGTAALPAPVGFTGTNVVRSVVPREYQTLQSRSNKAMEMYQSAVTPRAKALYAKRATRLFAESMLHDLAFLTLEKPVRPARGTFPKMGCDILSKGERVTLAGFGRNLSGLAYIDSNPARGLRFGSSWIDSNEHFYEMDYQVLRHVVNSGDSGGPLFKYEDQSVVYGVTSNVTMDRELKIKPQSSRHVMLGSERSREFFQRLANSPMANEELKGLLEDCLAQ